MSQGFNSHAPLAGTTGDRAESIGAPSAPCQDPAHAMLLRLDIKDFTLVDQLVVDFSQGFSAITGETGAGKSIMLGALALILGDRASPDLIRGSAPPPVPRRRHPVPASGTG